MMPIANESSPVSDLYLQDTVCSGTGSQEESHVNLLPHDRAGVSYPEASELSIPVFSRMLDAAGALNAIRTST
jgi:hypothetical protein